MQYINENNQEFEGGTYPPFEEYVSTFTQDSTMQYYSSPAQFMVKGSYSPSFFKQATIHGKSYRSPNSLSSNNITGDGEQSNLLSTKLPTIPKFDSYKEAYTKLEDNLSLPAEWEESVSTPMQEENNIRPSLYRRFTDSALPFSGSFVGKSDYPSPDSSLINSPLSGISNEPSLAFKVPTNEASTNFSNDPFSNTVANYTSMSKIRPGLLQLHSEPLLQDMLPQMEEVPRLANPTIHRSKRSNLRYNSGPSISEEIAKYGCKHCNKRFKRPSSLNTHMNIHTGNKPYVCPYEECRKSFNAKSNMLRHYKLHFKLNSGAYILPNGEISAEKPTSKQLFGSKRNEEQELSSSEESDSNGLLRLIKKMPDITTR
ncbi:C2H2-type zinc finger protein NDAI_0A07540 [Naumovozyma dairenensis CBS 421]|uniref:C2H2-type domain-containing protein n=1 Tax=Naumovozyma dairenensis (strain ATCC 10597 / BCRC 20456 / CBS 421 / NBRC 0211 / NRRL Y-12639) TaxID=1071378 RepID=G0W520_NAUDC|nr:hypothetical protein NDAI_0A07540 [Naumovozyma dairenensis CBS 421]CCD22908.1 hypothetical protein NDAI_0A07540 [Naumovozyma dairenensis CBS 421]